MYRRFFYLLIGFTYPIFWAMHASGTLALLYQPIQRLFKTDHVGWPSFLTASLIYLVLVVGFEVISRVRPETYP